MIWGALDWRADLLIAHREKTVSGIVTAHHPEDHDSYDYSYDVGNATYSGRAYLLKLNIGEPVTVFYEPDHPSKSQVESFSNPGTRPVPLAIFSALAILVYLRLKSWINRHYGDR
jgi:hypothetical protein